MEARLGPARAAEIMARACVAPPSGDEMIPEGEAARLHARLRREEPDRAAALAAEAGRRTADYILANRIPRAAQAILRLSPPPLAARLLARAIERHAWTFAGSGAFRAVDPWRFEITRNPLIRGETSETPLCLWHAAVFARLHVALVHRNARCEETCCAAAGGGVCRFEVRID